MPFHFGGQIFNMEEKDIYLLFGSSPLPPNSLSFYSSPPSPLSLSSQLSLVHYSSLGHNFLDQISTKSNKTQSEDLG